MDNNDNKQQEAEEEENNDYIEDLDISWINEFEKIDNEYKIYYTEELSFIRIHSIYVNNNNLNRKVIYLFIFETLKIVTLSYFNYKYVSFYVNKF